MLKPNDADIFRLLNQIVEPLVRSGYGSPGLFPVGLILLEAKGRKTGRLYTTPVVAKRWGNLFVVGTVRQKSQWLKNLKVHPHMQFWLNGNPKTATAFVLDAFQTSVSLPPTLTLADDLLVRGLRLLSRFYGIYWALLVPEEIRHPAAAVA